MIDCTKVIRRKKAAAPLFPARFSSLFVALIHLVSRSPVSAEPGPTTVTVEKVADGLGFPEGPVWHPDGFLLFSDIHNAAILRLLPEGGTTPWFTGGKKTNGLIFSPDRSSLYACCNSEKELLAVDPRTRQFRVLARNPDGRPFNDVNDAAVDSRGNVFFTDPSWTTQPGNVQGVYRYSPDGKVALAVPLDRQPNGIGISPDEKWIYVARYGADDIWRFRLGTDGSLSSGTQWVKLSRKAGPDGMTLDRQGNIYQAQAGNGQVAVISPEGRILQQIKVFDRMATNCELTGDDQKTLFVTGGGGREGTRNGAVYRVSFR